jgi:hypothetical protein
LAGTLKVDVVVELLSRRFRRVAIDEFEFAEPGLDRARNRQLLRKSRDAECRRLGKRADLRFHGFPFTFSL